LTWPSAAGEQLCTESAAPSDSSKVCRDAAGRPCSQCPGSPGHLPLVGASGEDRPSSGLLRTRRLRFAPREWSRERSALLRRCRFAEPQSVPSHIRATCCMRRMCRMWLGIQCGSAFQAGANCRHTIDRRAAAPDSVSLLSQPSRRSHERPPGASENWQQRLCHRVPPSAHRTSVSDALWICGRCSVPSLGSAEPLADSKRHSAPRG
jgi:hypothetical protein